jgi:hemerythrin
MTDALATLGRWHEEIGDLLDHVSDATEDRRAVLAELISRVAAHVSAEQSLMLPAAKAAGVDGDQLGQMRRHYRAMGKALLRIERRKVDSPDMPDLVTVLLDAFAAHVRLWDRVFAPALAKSLSAEERAALEEELSGAQQTILTHPHPHLLSLGPLSRLMTRLAGRFDAARDKTVTNLP